MKIYAILVVSLLLSAVLPATAQEVVRTANPLERGLGEEDFPRVQRLSLNVYTYEALTGRADDRYTTNTMFVVTGEGVLVADGQGNPEETARLVEEIRKITDRPVMYVVVCSDHGDHTNGNESFPKTAEFIAHTNSVATLSERAAGENPDSPAVIVPTAVVEERRVIRLGGLEIQILFYGRAHTGGDLFVYVPRDRILFTSEVFLNHMFAGYRSAYPSEWLEAIGRAERLDVDVYLPGHGFIDDPGILRQEWREYRLSMETVLNEVKHLYSLGLTVDEAIERARFGRFASWSGAGSQGPIGIRRIYAELNGELD